MAPIYDYADHIGLILIAAAPGDASDDWHTVALGQQMMLDPGFLRSIEVGPVDLTIQ